VAKSIVAEALLYAGTFVAGMAVHVGRTLEFCAEKR
jgi:hypothetical protein